jgi:hypothetical protein
MGDPGRPSALLVMVGFAGLPSGGDRRCSRVGPEWGIAPLHLRATWQKLSSENWQNAIVFIIIIPVCTLHMVL